MSSCIPHSMYSMPNGYGKNHKGLAHRQAWELAFGPIPEGMVVMHTCDNRECVNLEHLRLGTQSENIKESFDKGRRKPGCAYGSKAGSVKLTEDQVREIFASTEKGKDLADRFGVSPSTISVIKKGKKWRHLQLGQK